MGTEASRKGLLQTFLIFLENKFCLIVLLPFENTRMFKNRLLNRLKLTVAFLQFIVDELVNQTFPNKFVSRTEASRKGLLQTFLRENELVDQKDFTLG